MFTRLGSTGLEVSRIVLGMMSYGDPGWRDWVLDIDDARPFVERALELDVITFDTADVYSLGVSERVTGLLLGELIDDREDVVIATKCFAGTEEGPNRSGLSRKAVLAACDASLQRLGTDYIDLYQIHRWDPRTPIEETMGALHQLVVDGKVRYLGASSMYGWQFAKARRVAAERGWTPFVSMQNHYNLLYREEEREMLPQCADMGVGVLPWSPLARGLLARPPGEHTTTRAGADDLTGRHYGDAATAIIDRVGRVADRHGATRAQVALAWLLSKDVVTAPIIGATRIEHLEQAVAALDLELGEDDVAELEEPYQPRRIVGHR